MGTPFDDIYERFFKLVTDYTLLELDEDEVDGLLETWLISGIAGMRDVKVNGFEYDLNTHSFNYKLSNLELQLATLSMIEEWYNTQANSVLLTEQFLSSKEITHSHQHLHGQYLINAADKVRRDKNYLVSRYVTLHNDYLGTAERVVS